MVSSVANFDTDPIHGITDPDPVVDPKNDFVLLIMCVKQKCIFFFKYDILVILVDFCVYFQ